MEPTKSKSLPVTVLGPTIGRPELLRACLASLARCDPPAAEVLAADQSGGTEVSDVVRSFESAGARWVWLARGLHTFGLRRAGSR